MKRSQLTLWLISFLFISSHFSFVIASGLEAEQEENRQKFNALSIDGGGIRGIIPAIILAKIEKKTGKPIYELFDYIGGTSTGGLLALGLTVPKAKKREEVPDYGEDNYTEARYSAKDLIELFTGQERFRVFSSSWKSKLKSGKQYLGALYSAEDYDKLLSEKFGNAFMSQALTNILVTATQFENKNMVVFSKEGKERGEHILEGDYLMRDIARATSAAPSYFLPGKVTEPQEGKETSIVKYYVDGGMCCNNPAQLVWNRIQRKKIEGHQATPENTYLLSLGTGMVKPTTHPATNEGVARWIPWLSYYFMNGNSWSVHYELQNLLGDNYVRLQPTLEKEIDLAGVDDANLTALKEAAATIDDQEIDRISHKLLANKGWTIAE